MAHEENTPNSNGGAGGGRLSKKLKNKKVSQRGMGVAQLEKIILDEQEKNDVVIVTPNPTNFRPPSIPLPPPLPPNHHLSLIPITDATNPVFISKLAHTISNGGNPCGRLRIGGDYRYELENPNPNPNQNQNQNRQLDHRAYAASIPSNLSDLRPYSITTRKRSHLFQQPCSSSMGNTQLGTTTTSSVMNFQMELPSNQSYCSNNYPPMYEQNQQMVGMKRPYPFLVENMPIPSFNFKIHFSPLSRLSESASCSHGCTTGLELLPTPVFRENPSSLVAKDFLTLAPPRSSSKEKLAPISIRESSLPHHQGQPKDPSGSNWSNRQTLYSFFPAANSDGEEGEYVDLNLKL